MIFLLSFSGFKINPTFLSSKMWKKGTLNLSFVDNFIFMTVKPYAPFKERIRSGRFCFILPIAKTSIISNARLHLNLIFLRPLMKCLSKPYTLSSRGRNWARASTYSRPRFPEPPCDPGSQPQVYPLSLPI